MFCQKCGAENKDSAAFCNECGADLCLAPPNPSVATNSEGNNRKTYVILAFVVIAMIGIAMLAAPRVSTSGQTEEQRVFEKTLGYKLVGDHSPPLKEQGGNSGTDQIGLVLVLIGAVGALGSFYYYRKK